MSRQMSPGGGRPPRLSLEELLRRGLQLHQAGRGAEAARHYEQILAIDPRQPAANHLLGLIRLSQGKPDEAVRLITRAVALNGKEPQFLSNLGVALNAAGKPREAVAALDRAIALKPDFAEAWSNKGMALKAMGRNDAAADAYREAVRLKPTEPGFHLNLANALHAAGNWFGAETSYRRAIRLRPRYPAAIYGLATTLDGQGRQRDALELLEMALLVMPGEAGLHMRRARALYHLDRLTDAVASVRRALQLDPRLGEAHLQLMLMIRRDVRDDEVRALEALVEDESVPVTERTYGAFGLGKALADIGEHRRSVAVFEQANRLRRQQLEFSVEKAVAAMAADARRFENVAAPRPGAGFADAAPIFVVGLPRSGKTTLETILSRHPSVYPAGELPTMGRLVGELRQQVGEVPPDAIAGDRLTELGRAYMEEARNFAPGGETFVDTMPSNYRHIGFIRLALPNARIVHCHRPAADHCIAIFEKYLTSDGYDYSNDLDELRAYHAAYRTLMAGWERLFPGAIHTMSPGALGSDREREIRKLLQFCGLSWSDACLAEARSEPQLGDWPEDRLRRNRSEHMAAWREAHPELWANAL